MKTTRQLTAIIEREGDGYVSLCPEFDLASQGDTVEEARSNFIEAIPSGTLRERTFFGDG